MLLNSQSIGVAYVVSTLLINPIPELMMPPIRPFRSKITEPESPGSENGLDIDESTHNSLEIIAENVRVASKLTRNICRHHSALDRPSARLVLVPLILSRLDQD